MGTLDRIVEKYPNELFLKADGFDDAVIGFEVNTGRLVYSIPVCLKILMNEGLDEQVAFDYFNDNILDADEGYLTPIFIDDNF
jgi:hypothetical protein